MYSRKPTKNKNKSLCIIVILLLAVISFVVVYKLFSDKKSSTDNGANESKVNQIDYSPPTEDEKTAGDKQKEELVTNEPGQQLPNTAEVVIVDASQYDDEVEVRAFVANVIEDGTCIYTFTKEDVSFVKSSQAYADATTTPCIALSIPVSEFPSKGNWLVEVKYENDSLQGSSTKTLEII